MPGLHEHAQWSDLVFAAAALMWVIERWRLKLLPRVCPAHVALTLYFFFACLSLFFATSNPLAGLPKLLGVAELCALALITSDLGSRPHTFVLIARTIAVTSLIIAGAAILGLVCFYSGVSSQLIGIYGELEPSRWYARVQATTDNPNLLASFCIFASAIVAHRDGELPVWLRRITLTALGITVFVTFSRGILGFVLALAIRAAKTQPGRRVAAVVAAVCVGLVVSLTIWNPAFDPAHPFDLSLRAAESSRHHTAISSLATLVRHPLVGSGLGTNPGQYRGAPFDAHLTPLNIAATLGLPSLISFAFLIASLWRRRVRPTDLCIWGGLAGLALDGLGQDIEDFRHLWVMIGLAGATVRSIKTSSRLTEAETSSEP